MRMYLFPMSARAYPEELAASIGTFSVSLVGEKNLRGLQVFVDSAVRLASVSVALVNNSDRCQKRALAELADVERAFFDDAVFSFSFVRDIDHGVVNLAPSVSHYSYA